MQFCEFCANILLENGHCPDAECVHNLLLEIEEEEEATKGEK